MESFILPPFPTPAATHHWDPPKGGCKETARAIQVTTRPADVRHMGPQRHFRKSYFFRTGDLHIGYGYGHPASHPRMELPCFPVAAPLFFHANKNNRALLLHAPETPGQGALLSG